MPITIDDALKDEFVAVVDRDDRAGLYRIRIGSLKKTVTIRPPDSGGEPGEPSGSVGN